MGKVILERSNRQNSKGEDLYVMKIASGRSNSQARLNQYWKILRCRTKGVPTRTELLEYIKEQNRQWLEESIRMALRKLIATIDYNVEDHTDHVDVTAELHVLLTKEQIELLTKDQG